MKVLQKGKMFSSISVILLDFKYSVNQVENYVLSLVVSISSLNSVDSIEIYICEHEKIVYKIKTIVRSMQM